MTSPPPLTKGGYGWVYGGQSQQMTPDGYSLQYLLCSHSVMLMTTAAG